MARIFITGSSTGLGLMTGRLLISNGHQVVLHARNQQTADRAMASAPGAEAWVIGDISHIQQMRSVAAQVNRLGSLDVIIHNAGIGYKEPCRIETDDGLPHVFATNVLAPYILTALISRPTRLIYLSSGVHTSVRPNLRDLLWKKRNWDGLRAYAESKLYDAVLAFSIARLWPDVLSNAVDPGWVATRMGGPDATDDLNHGHLTQVWLSESDDSLATSSGEYFYRQAPAIPNPAVRDETLQEQLLQACASLSEIRLPLSHAKQETKVPMTVNAVLTTEK